MNKSEGILETNKWEEALSDAQGHLADARKNLYEWKAAVRACKEMIAAGEPWPGEKGQNN